jgi:fatty-acyl-CoA synthase
VRVETTSGIIIRADRAAVLAPTPRTNIGLQQQNGPFGTLWQALDYAARGRTGMNFYNGRGLLDHAMPYGELRDRAVRTAHRLIAAGFRRGDRVAVVAETNPSFMDVFFGCQYAGLVPCPVPYSMSVGGKDTYVERIAGMFRSAKVSAAITSPEFVDYLTEAAGPCGSVRVLTHGELNELPSAGQRLEPFRPDEVAYIQYSSGSTSAPKGVLISQRAICANSFGILQHGLQFREGDRAFSWLPLYHDMGLVGFCISPVVSQGSVDYLATSAFARRPGLWLKLMSENQCTIAYSPSFGYDLAARRAGADVGTLDLAQWRIAGIGGDMVRPEILEAFAEAFAPAGFDRRAFLPSYGMAETTLAITFGDLDRAPRIDVVDRARYKLRRIAMPASPALREMPGRTRAFVACGRPLPGHEIVVVNDKGRPLADREIGHILVRGASIMAGYFDNRLATEEVMCTDGFLRTGDMGYWLDGEIVITGRAKDLILLNGRNIWPQDIEWAVEQLEAVRSGDVAAFAVETDDGEDKVIVMVECRASDARELEQLRAMVARRVREVAGIDCEVLLVAPRTLPFTSSGKLSRSGARQRYLQGLADIAMPPAGGASREAELAVAS